MSNRPVFFIGGTVSIWIILHEYKESASPYLVKCHVKPTQEQAKKVVGKGFKPRSGDTIRVIGPYDPDTLTVVGKQRKRRREEPVKEEYDFDPFEEDE